MTDHVTEPAQQTDDTVRCTKNDEFVLRACTCPECMANREVELQKRQIITDDVLVDYGYFSGYIFKCPHCGLNAVMVNDYMGEACCACHKPVEVRSKKVTEAVRNGTMGR